MTIIPTTPMARPGHGQQMASFGGLCAVRSNPGRTNRQVRFETKRCLVPLLFAALVIGLLPLRADEFQQLKITVNRLDSATVPNLAQRQKDMNAILKKTDKYGKGKTRMRVTLVQGRQNADPKDGGNSIAPDGKVPNDDATWKLVKGCPTQPRSSSFF